MAAALAVEIADYVIIDNSPSVPCGAAPRLWGALAIVAGILSLAAIAVQVPLRSAASDAAPRRRGLTALLIAGAVLLVLLALAEWLGIKVFTACWGSLF